MVETLAGLLQAIIVDRDDDVVRFAYADACEESGDNERAEFVRWQMAGSGGHSWPWRQEWMPVYFQGRMHIGWWKVPDGIICIFPDETSCTFRRGFVEGIKCTSADWLEHADALLTVAPIREVQLTTWPMVYAAVKSESDSYTLDVAVANTRWYSRSDNGRPMVCRDLWPDHHRAFVVVLLNRRWPDIRFTLPES